MNEGDRLLLLSDTWLRIARLYGVVASLDHDCDTSLAQETAYHQADSFLAAYGEWMERTSPGSSDEPDPT